MSETPSEQPSESKGSEPVGQDDIDALLNDSVPESAGDAKDADTGDASPVSENAGLLSQSDIDAALGGGGDAPRGDAGDAQNADTGDASPASESAALFSQADIDAALGVGGDAPRGDAGGAAAAMAPAAPQPTSPPGKPPPDAVPLQLQEIGRSADASGFSQRVSMLKDVNLRVKIELGRTRMLVEEVLKLGAGSVVELDKLAGDPVDVLVNERLIARGEVLVLNDTFCVRISEVLTEDPHRICV